MKHTQVEIADAIHSLRKSLADLVHSQPLGDGDLTDAVRQITATASWILDVERTSVWRLVDDGATLECLDLLERTGASHSAGARIAATDVPRYFEALRTERVIAAADARTDPRTREFRESYLEPHGITGMLDAPVFARGQTIGVVCHEHTGSPREWELADELLAGTFADFVALVIEMAGRRRAYETLRLEREALESRVAERTAALEDNERSLRALLDGSPVSMVLTRVADHTIAFANRRAAAMFEVDLDDLVGRHGPDFGAEREACHRFLVDLAQRGRVDDSEVLLHTGKGRAFWCRLSAQRLRFLGENTFLAAMIDISDQRRAQQRLSDLATHDSLTGLYNRRHLEDVMRSELDRARRYARPLTVAILDADHFKRINDTHGHQAGDEVLRTVSARCQHTVRSNDVLGRYGGEEFVVIFPETTLDEARVVAERIRAAVASSPVTIGDCALEVTISIGLATLDAAHDPVALLASADSALYAAKQSGRNRVLAALPG